MTGPAMRAQLHRSAREALSESGGAGVPANGGLYWDRFFDRWSIGGPDRPRPPPPGTKGCEAGGKRAWIDWFASSRRWGDRARLDEWHERLKLLVRVREGWQDQLQLDSSFVTGLGAPHPTETGFAWHPTLGVPYLPDSSLKGMVRQFVHEILLASGPDSDLDVGDRVDLEGKVRRILGEGSERTAGGAGSVAFLDAVPTTPVQLEAAIVTPHVKDGTPPADWVEPTPIPFLAVAPDVCFRFALLPCSLSCLPLAQARADMATARDWLIGALLWVGAGAKTALAFGHFEQVRASPASDNAQA